MDTKQTLQDLGLEKKEVDLYLALLELEESSVLKIAQRAGIKRPTAYVVLRSLEQKGFVSRILKGRKTSYAASHPQKLVSEAQMRLKDIEDILPHLESLYRKRKDKPKIIFYEGKEELDRAYDDSFLLKGALMYMGTLRLSLQAFPKTFKKAEYISHSPEYDIRELIDESKESKEYAKQVQTPYRQVRFIPKKYLPFEVDIGIFGNKTLITSVKKEYFTICIESKEIAKAFKTLFEVMWSISKNVYS